MQVREVLRKNGFRFEKRYGQNFLTDENLLSDPDYRQSLAYVLASAISDFIK